MLARGRTRLAAFAQLQPVAVRIGERGEIGKRVLEDATVELHAARLEHLDRLAAVRRLDRVRGRDAAVRRLALARCSGPEDKLEVLILDADGQKPRSVRRRIL